MTATEMKEKNYWVHKVESITKKDENVVWNRNYEWNSSARLFKHIKL